MILEFHIPICCTACRRWRESCMLHRVSVESTSCSAQEVSYPHLQYGVDGLLRSVVTLTKLATFSTSFWMEGLMAPWDGSDQSLTVHPYIPSASWSIWASRGPAVRCKSIQKLFVLRTWQNRRYFSCQTAISYKLGQSSELLTSARIASLELLKPGFCTLTVLDKMGAPMKLEAATAQETDVMVTMRSRNTLVATGWSLQLRESGVESAERKKDG